MDNSPVHGSADDLWAFPLTSGMFRLILLAQLSQSLRVFLHDEMKITIFTCHEVLRGFFFPVEAKQVSALEELKTEHERKIDELKSSQASASEDTVHKSKLIELKVRIFITSNLNRRT